MNMEIVKKAREAGSVEELLSLAEENNIELSKEKAEEDFSRMNSEGEIHDDELDSVTGGGCGIKKPDGAKYSVGQIVNMKPYIGGYGNHQWCRYCTLGNNKAEIVDYPWETDYITLQKIPGTWVKGTYIVRCIGCNATVRVDDDEIIGA